MPIATLGPTEIITESLLGADTQALRWCLQPMGKVELLILPRRDWIDTIRQASLRAFGQLSELRANFYQRQLQLASRPLPTTLPAVRQATNGAMPTRGSGLASNLPSRASAAGLGSIYRLGGAE